LCIHYSYTSQEDANKPITQRHWFKANVWNFIYSHIGNYFWTHYFYRLLGARYTFESWRLNDVPYCLFLITQAYFILYHALSNKVNRQGTRERRLRQ
jgi:cycloeucalenol cycloisomerase